MKKTKKIISSVLALVLLAMTLCQFSFAADNGSTVYVTISNKGSLVVTNELISVKDTDGDGALTVADVLYLVHEAKYQGGADAGYSSYHGDYGYSLGKLWGDASGSFGYYVNNNSCMSLADNVKNGDHVYAYVYADSAAWSDSYSFFDVYSSSVKAGDNVTLTLNAYSYDENWNLLTLPVKNASITVNGVKKEVLTDENGKATFSVDEEGSYTISAVSENMILVPPVCILTVEKNQKNEDKTETDDSQNAPDTTPENDKTSETGEEIKNTTGSAATGDNVWVLVFILTAAFALLIAVLVMRKKNNEK